MGGSKFNSRDAPPEAHQVRPESREPFKPSYASSKVKNENNAVRNWISMILTRGAFLNHKSNKQTIHEVQKNLDSS